MSNRYINPAKFDPVILTTSSGNKVEITSLVREINVYESLLNNFITADITITDIPARRLVQEGMIGAKDKISFSFAGKKEDFSAEPPISLELFVYKVVNSGPAGQTLQTAKIYLVPEEFFTNQTKEISRHFENKISIIVKKLCNEIGITDLDTEETQEEYKFISTYHSPLEIINFLTTKAISTRNSNDYNYVFYQDIDKKFHFITIGSLLGKESKFGTNSQNGFVHVMPLDGTEAILKNMVLNYDSYELSPVKNAMGGMYTSQITTYDITNKYYDLWTFVLDMIFDAQTHLSDKKVIEGNGDEFEKTLNSSYLTRYAQKSSYLYDCDENKGFQNKIGGPEDTILPRTCTMEQLNQLSIKISINGNSTVRAGDVFYFGRPTQQELSKDKPNPDIFYNGKYLAIDVVHSVQYNVRSMMGLEYRTIIRGIKDSIGDE